MFYNAYMSEALLQTKLHVPRARAGLVVRSRLVGKLDTSLLGKLTLVSAPAGYGKTTLITAWHSESEEAQNTPLAWLSLDAGDNDLPRFLLYLVAALQQVDVTIGRDTLAMLAAPQRPSTRSLLAPLLNEMDTRRERIALILDDYHAVEAPEIHEAIAYVVDHQPASLHIVLVTREDPPLPLSRWRARGEMTEIRQADLRFTAGETASFLNDMMSLALSAGQIAALDARAEGWIAGLQLAALAMQGRDDVETFVHSFTGSNRYILDYLVEEVLQQQPRDVQQFLLVTSILDRFTVSLCDALLQNDKAVARSNSSFFATRPSPAQAILEHLERANLFIVPLDADRRWFRYHHLFSDLLQHHLRRQDWDIDKLHRQAGRWFADNEILGAAIDHFLAARSWDEAATVISTHGETLLRQGEVRRLYRWLQLLPEAAMNAHPQLRVNYAWTQIFRGELDVAAALLDANAGSTLDDPLLQAGLLTARAHIARLRHDLPRSIQLSEQALALTPPADHNTRSVLNVGLGIAHLLRGELPGAARALIATIHESQQVGNQYAQLMGIGLLGLVRASQGLLHQAAELLEAGLRWGQSSPASATAHYILGALFYEWNELEKAARYVEQAVALAPRSGNIELIDGAYRQLARLRQRQGDAAGALAALDEVGRAAGDEASPLLRSRLAAAYVDLALAQGDPDLARHWAGQRLIPMDAGSFYPWLDLVPARLSLAAGDRDAAARHLSVQRERAAAAGWHFGLVETCALQALASAGGERALMYLEEALALAEPEGYARTFADKGEPMAALLRQAAARSLSPDYTQRLLAAFDRPAVPAPAVPVLAESLSEREVELLQLLARHRSNAEIAATLVISANTVKTHLRHIYEKLGVHDRRSAVAHARELGLLPSTRPSSR